jgi:hypothetical protein
MFSDIFPLWKMCYLSKGYIREKIIPLSVARSDTDGQAKFPYLIPAWQPHNQLMKYARRYRFDHWRQLQQISHKENALSTELSFISTN